MTLTAKQEAFCQAIASGMNQSDAYRSAYDAGNMKPESINVNASKLCADAKVALRVTELKDEIAAKALWTREDSVLTLKAIADKAEAKDSDKTGAVKVLNEMHGYNAPKEINVTGNLNINVNFD